MLAARKNTSKEQAIERRSLCLGLLRVTGEAIRMQHMLCAETGNNFTIAVAVVLEAQERHLKALQFPRTN